MINDCHYNKIKTLYELCKIAHFIKMHAKNDAKKAGDEKCYKFLEELEKDLEKYAKQLNEMICK